MERDFTLAALKDALEEGYGLSIETVTPLPGHAHSLNFKVETAEGPVFVAKCFPAKSEKMFARLFAHTASVTDPHVSSRLFEGKVLSFGAWKVMAIRWIEGTRRYPDELTDAETDAFLSAHAAFLGDLTDDGEILPVRDGLALKKALLERLKGGNAPALARELKLLDDAHLTLAPETVRIIHGDLHWENFRFGDDGKVSGFLDIEEFRFGTPAEDIVRYIVCRAERLRWYEIFRVRRLGRAFRAMIRRTSHTRREWLFAIDGYLLRKLDKKIKSNKVPFFTRLNLAMRLKGYRLLRGIVREETARAPSDGRVVVRILGGTVKRFMGTRVFDWGDRFRFVCDPGCADYDWLCVYDELPPGYPGVRRGKFRARCPKSRTMLLTQEPVSLKSYNSAYTRQFGVYLTNRPREAERHPGYRKGAGYMVWYTGRSFAEERSRAIPEKTKTLSAVYSAKRMTHTQHGNRFAFLARLQMEIPGFEWYGKGIRPIDRKSDVLDDFKYHLAFENHIGAGHWTEKLSDALVAGCLPFYAGDPEIASVLPAGSFIPIPADDPDAALKVIREAIASNAYETHRTAVAEARELLFTRYNLFAQIAEAIDLAPAPAADEPPETTLVTRRHTRLYPRAALADLIHHMKRIFKKS